MKDVKTTLLACLLLLPASALATPPRDTALPVLTVPQIVELLVGRGYHDIEEIEWKREKQVYRVEARNKQGDEVDVVLDGNGKMLDAGH